MKIEHSQMDKYGRILIPSNIRNSLNYKQGDTFVIRAINDELHIVSINKEIKAAQKLFKKYNNRVLWGFDFKNKVSFIGSYGDWII